MVNPDHFDTTPDPTVYFADHLAQQDLLQCSGSVWNRNRIRIRCSIVALLIFGVNFLEHLTNNDLRRYEYTYFASTNQ
jgi:hypothetical protein